MKATAGAVAFMWDIASISSVANWADVYGRISAQEFLIWETLPSPDSISPRDAWHRAALVFPLSNSATVVGHNP